MNGFRTPEPPELTDRQTRKRQLEESPLKSPIYKRRKIGPKSRTTPRKITETVSYEPFSLLQCVLNTINKENVPDYESECCEEVKEYTVQPKCLHCEEEFESLPELAKHEAKEHVKVNLFDRVDNGILWNSERIDAKVC